MKGFRRRAPPKERIPPGKVLPWRRRRLGISARGLRAAESDRNRESGEISEAKTLDTAARSGAEGRGRAGEEGRKREK